MNKGIAYDFAFSLPMLCIQFYFSLSAGSHALDYLRKKVRIVWIKVI